MNAAATLSYHAVAWGRQKCALVDSVGRTSLFQSIVAVTLLSELQKGQENDTSSFGFCFLGGGFDDFLLPMGLISNLNST